LKEEVVYRNQVLDPDGASAEYQQNVEKAR
jgi:hypothetical protein